MAEIILWKPHVSRHFPEGMARGPIDVACEGGHLHDNLGYLITELKHDRNAGEKWSVAKVECSPNHVTRDHNLPSGWYKAIGVLNSKDGFVPLEEAETRYQAYIN